MTKLRTTRDETLGRLREYRTTTDAGKREAIETLLLAENEPFVHFVARQYQRGVALDDLLAIARSAMLTAIRRFDLSKSEQFPMYASRCMRRDLLTEVRRMAGPVAKPRHEKQWPSSVSMEFDHDGAGSLHDMLEAEDDTAAGAIAAEDVARIAAALEGLAARDAQVVRLRFGLDGGQPHGLAEIAALLGVTKQRVHVILSRALAALREQLTDSASAPASQPVVPGKVAA
jgi:RNA polymerase sigma factor (sigma-70 family)